MINQPVRKDDLSDEREEKEQIQLDDSDTPLDQSDSSEDEEEEIPLTRSRFGRQQGNWRTRMFFE